MVRSEGTGVWGAMCGDELDDGQVRFGKSLHVAMADAGIGAWRYERDTGRLYFDELLRKLYELPPAGPLRLDEVLQRVHPDDRLGFKDALSGNIECGTFCYRHRTMLDDGSECWFDWTAKPDTRGGERNDMLGVCVDVTAQMKAQRRLAAEKDRIHAIANGVPGKFGYWDSNYRVQFLSKEYRLARGFEGESITGRHIRDIIGEKAFEQRRGFFDRALAGEVVSFEDSGIGDHEEMYLDTVTYQPDFDEHGKVRGIFTLRVNITNRHMLEEKLRRVSEDLARSNAELEQFAYVASHDLKAPLRAIQVLVEWLTEDLEGYDQGEVQQNLELLSRRASRMNKLLDDLLDYSRAGRQRDAPERVALDELVNEIAELLNPEQAISVGMTGDSVSLLTNRTALHQVLRNLIGNAVKHHPGPSGQVSVDAVDCGSHHVVSVADDGEGIPEEFAEKVFKMFQTLKPRDEVEGSGMGLAIVERIVRDQGGTIWFETPENGKGTVFKFTWFKRQPDD